MGSYLLDTHIVVWAALEPERLSKKAQAIISSPEELLFFSSASVWEIAIKYEKGGLSLKRGCDHFVAECIDRLRLSVQPIGWQDCLRAASLPKIHRDPFDRMIIQHAKDRSLKLVTADPVFKRYGIKVVE